VSHPNTDMMHQIRVWFYAGGSEAFAAAYIDLRRQLTDEQAGRLKEVVDLAERSANDRQTEALYGLLGNVARHFPGLAPAILAVGQPIIGNSPPERCGVSLGIRADRDPDAGWVDCEGAVPAELDGPHDQPDPVPRSRPAHECRFEGLGGHAQPAPARGLCLHVRARDGALHPGIR
jgi:hypothetical protein